MPPQRPKPACFLPWQNLLIRADGQVRICCFTTEVLGDLNYQTFEGIWNGPAARQIRREMLAGRIPEVCRSCPLINDYQKVSRETFHASRRKKGAGVK